MQGSLNLTGHILAMPPKGSDSSFQKSVVLVVQHREEGAWGVVVNKINPRITLDAVMRSAGIDYRHTQPVFTGGPVETQRIHVVHSLDWRSQSTISITPEIGITGDVSVLAAISIGEGPQFYRTCLGVSGWGPKQLDGEYKGLPPWTTRCSWIDAPATLESIFNGTGDEQWEQSIGIIASSKIKTWF